MNPFADEPSEDDQPKSIWVRVVPKGLQAFALSDIITALLVLNTLGMDCNVPLRMWLLGGVLLGYPFSYLVRRVADSRPAMRWFRMTVSRLRGGGDPANFQIEGLQLYDRFNQPVHRIESMEEHQDMQYWFASFREGHDVVKGYQVITHVSADPALDPVCWTLEGSVDGVDWTVLDEVEGPEMPRTRGTATAIFDELMHLEEVVSVFRFSFLVEVLGNLAAFLWLVTGTAWVSRGTLMCVDSAPLLWYACYFLIVIVWSFLGTITVGLIVSAVAMVILGSKGAAPGAGTS